MKPLLVAALLLCIPARAQITTTIDPGAPLEAGHTVVWSPLFQATWDRMNQALGSKANRVVPPNPLMAKLDHFEWQADQVMPDGQWKTWAGQATQEFLDSVHDEAVELLGDKNATPFTLPEPNSDHLVLFGLLDIEVEFTKAFYRSQKQALQFQKQPVSFFGVKGETSGQFNHVKVISYRPKRRSHAIEIPCRQSDDKVVLYQPENPQDFTTACRWLRHWRHTCGEQAIATNGWNAGYLQQGDQICIPYLTFDTTANVTDQLQGSRFHGIPGDPWTIVLAKQKTSFALHERGARVRVKTTMAVDPFGSPLPPPLPRYFIYDRPFFVFLWRDNAKWPHLGVWVGDTSAMEPKP